LNPKSTRVAGDLVDSKEHWDRPMTWLNPRSTGVAGGLVDSKEYYRVLVAWLNPRRSLGWRLHQEMV
jgi:hypothetical protein